MGMSMMEKAALQMLQNMTGLTPEQMQKMAADGMSLLYGLDERLKRIEEAVLRIDTNTPDLAGPVTLIEDKSNAEKRTDN